MRNLVPCRCPSARYRRTGVTRRRRRSPDYRRPLDASDRDRRIRSSGLDCFLSAQQRPGANYFGRSRAQSCDDRTRGMVHRCASFRQKTDYYGFLDEAQPPYHNSGTFPFHDNPRRPTTIWGCGAAAPSAESKYRDGGASRETSDPRAIERAIILCDSPALANSHRIGDFSLNSFWSCGSRTNRGHQRCLSRIARR